MLAVSPTKADFFAAGISIFKKEWSGCRTCGDTGRFFRCEIAAGLHMVLLAQVLDGPILRSLHVGLILSNLTGVEGKKLTAIDQVIGSHQPSADQHRPRLSYLTV
jgi:hypothetical protein